MFALIEDQNRLLKMFFFVYFVLTTALHHHQIQKAAASKKGGYYYMAKNSLQQLELTSKNVCSFFIILNYNALDG